MSPHLIEKLLLESTVARYVESFEPVNTVANTISTRQYFHLFLKKAAEKTKEQLRFY